jgi:hypothetical protein
MEARIKDDSLKVEYEALMREYLNLLALTKSTSKPGWESKARDLNGKFTMMLRRVDTLRPLTSTERSFREEAKAKVLGALSNLDRLLKH